SPHSFPTRRSSDLIEEPLWKIAPQFNFGVLGVDCFFVISGFLVTQSWLARQKLLPFTAARVLRVYPALIVATIFSIVLASWSAPQPFRGFIAEPLTFEYLWRNASGLGIGDRLPGAYLANPYPGAVNGSLWT